MKRDRIFRLIQYIITHKTRLGIGLAEDTGIVIYPEDSFYVIGSAYVTLVRADRLKYSNYNRIEEGERLVADGVNIGYLSEGYGYCLKTGKVINPKNRKEKILNNLKETEIERFSGK